MLRVNAASPVPPYEQIRAQITTMITAGVLPLGARLPTIRQLASDLGLAGGTVARAYRELEAEGAIATRGRHGTFVEQGPPNRTQTSEGRNQLAEAAHAFALQVRQIGAAPANALAEAERALSEIS
jgi:DNA-binding transcriptional regulator YhcF (GntR family)